MSTTLDIQTLYRALQEKLGFVWLSGEQYKEQAVHTSDNDNAEDSLVGYLNLIAMHRVQVLGRKELPGRPLIYSTTKRFLEVFDLKDLKDLPTPKEIEELGNSATDKTDRDFFNDTKSTDQDKGNNT